MNLSITQVQCTNKNRACDWTCPVFYLTCWLIYTIPIVVYYVCIFSILIITTIWWITLLFDESRIMTILLMLVAIHFCLFLSLHMFLCGSDIPAERLGTHHSQHVFQLAGHLQVDRRCGGMKSGHGRKTHHMGEMKNWIHGTLNLLGVVIRLFVSFSKSQYRVHNYFVVARQLLVWSSCVHTLFRLPFYNVFVNILSMFDNMSFKASNSAVHDQQKCLLTSTILILRSPHVCCWNRQKRLTHWPPYFVLVKSLSKKWSFVAQPRIFTLIESLDPACFPTKMVQNISMLCGLKEENIQRDNLIFDAPP